MTIQTDLTPTQCKLIRICLEFDGAGDLIRSDAEIDIYNAADNLLLRHTTTIAWTAGEQTTIENNVTSKYTAFKTANSFTEYVEVI